MTHRASIEVPYDEQGNLLHHRSYLVSEWRPIEPFTVPLQYRTYHRGYSAAYFELSDPDGRTYPVFLTDMDAILRTLDLADGRTPAATWTPYKRGVNYGIKLLENS